MANASFVQTGFTGGEISQSAQGRMELPAYKLSMNVCLNGIPTETGAWQRRPGTRHVAPTRGGKTGRLIAFAFEENFPYNMEFTDGFLRFTTGPALVMTNDAQSIFFFDTNNPVNVATPLPHGWSPGQSVFFSNLGANNPLLQNRVFTIKTVPNPSTITLADSITGATIDGSTLGPFVSGTVSRVLEIATTYNGGSWLNLRSVQAETRALLLNGSLPQVLQVAAQPTTLSFATFTFGPADFIDGPYLDPIANSVVNSNALNGVVTLTFSFAAWVSSQAYNVGDFVTFVGICYKSLTPLNQNNEPDTHPANWAVVNGGAAVNNGLGFVASDIGRLIRLLSEPALWSTIATYVAGNIVAYADGLGGFSYWTATGAIAAGVQPGTSTSWALNATGATWTWAQIVSVSGSGLITPVAAIGNMTAGGGVPSAFDGNTSKTFASGAGFSTNIVTFAAWQATIWGVSSQVQYGGNLYQAKVQIYPFPSSYPNWSGSISYTPGQFVTFGANIYQCIATSIPGNNPLNILFFTFFAAVSGSPPPLAVAGLWTFVKTLSSPTLDVNVGQHYSTPTAIQSATLFPSNDVGLANCLGVIQVVLRGSNSAPASPSSGTLLGIAIVSNTTSAISIVSNDQVTTWSYIWFEILAPFTQPLIDNGSHIFTAQVGVAQVKFFGINISNGSVVTAQIRGVPLLYNQTVRTWQAGVYSNTTGWPTCGAYHESRIWLGGVVSNRFDACVSNGFNGTEIDFTPTSPDGTVSANNSISYICNGEGSNQINWFAPDQQGVLFGSLDGEWLISAPSAGAMAPNNIKAVRVTKIGSSGTEPRRAEHTLLVIQKFGRKIVEFFSDVFSGKYTAPDLSERAKHLTVSGIAEIAYQQELASIIWQRRNDGALIGATYKRDTLTTSQGPNIIGHHRHQLGSGRLVESICVGPSVGGTLENLSLLTNDPSTGIRHIEIMTDLLDEGFALTSCWLLDDAIAPTSAVVQAAPTGGPSGSLLLNGLSVHNGKTLTAFVAGLDCGDYLVTSGSITIPFGDGISGGTASGLFTAALVNSFPALPAVVGFTYNSDGQLVRPVTQADTGTREGPGFGKLGRQHRAAALLYGCVNGSISFGTDFNTLYAAKLLQPNGVAFTPQQLWNGIWRDNTNSIYDFDNMISWRISRPLPAFVMAVGGFDAKADA